MRRAFVCLALVAVVPALAGARLTPGEWLRDGLEHLGVNGYAVPAVVDYGGDGARDLLVGEYLGTEPYAYGKIRLYRNCNTDEHPRFDGWAYLQAAGQDIQVTGKTDT